MLESKLEYTVNELLKNKDPRRNKIYLDEVGELLLKLPYFKMLMEEYPDPDLGPLMFINLLNHLIIQKYEPNSLIWEYNDKVTGVYIIITGEVKIYKPPNKAHLIRYKKIKRKEINLFDEQDNLNKNKKTLSGKYKKATKNLFSKNESSTKIRTRRTSLYRASYFRKNTIVKKQKIRTNRSASCICLSTDIKLEIDLKKKNNNNKNNGELKEYGDEISLTDINFIFRELLNYREFDYIETFGKMIGEDCLLQNLKYRPYCAEALTKCILGFLTINDYHILFDKINSINKANIISFLYNVNYFNNKNNFVHKLYRGIKTILYSKGRYIYKQNDPFRNMFIIKKGNVNINLVKIVKVETDVNPDLILGNNKYKNINHIKELKEIEHFTCDRIFEIKGEYYEKKIYTIVNYGVGEILGNLEYFGHFKNYLCSAQCISNVELYEIDTNLYKKIESNDNIEFLNKKTKNQLEFFRKRINEINIIHKKNNKEFYLGRDKFMKAYYHNNPPLPLKEKEKEFINNPNNPLPIKIKLKNKKLKNTKISPFTSREWASIGKEIKNNIDINKKINEERPKSSSPFITNNKEYAKIFNENNNKNNNIFNINNNIEENMPLFSPKFQSTKSLQFNFIKSRNKTRYKTLSVLKNEKCKKPKIIRKKERQFDYSMIFASNCYNKYLSYSSLSPKNSINEKNTINRINNNFLNKKVHISFRTPPKDIYSFSSSKNITNVSSPKRNIFKKLNEQEESKKENEEENKNEIIEKKILSDKIVNRKIKFNMGTTIAFHGYRVFLPKKIDKKKIRELKRFNSYRIDNVNQFGKKNTILKKETEKEKDYNNVKKNNNNNIEFNRKINNKTKTFINNNIYKPIRIKSFLG